MDNQRTKMLGENLTHYRNLQENGSVNLIEFHTTDNRKFGIGNPDAIKLLLSAAVTELERQLHIAQSGGLSERLEQSREYKAAKALEQALNDTGFSPERFAKTLPFFHKTLEQTFFRTIKACIIAMAKRESCRIDSRNQASYEMCRMLAPMLEDTDLPFI